MSVVRRFKLLYTTLPLLWLVRQEITVWCIVLQLSDASNALDKGKYSSFHLPEGVIV